jgi:hypothetical protein
MLDLNAALQLNRAGLIDTRDTGCIRGKISQI